mgnify:FL=1
MQYKDVIIGGEDLDRRTREALEESIREHIWDIYPSTCETLTGFTWRIDVRMRTDNES